MEQLNIILETTQYIVVEKPAGINVERWDGFESIEAMVYDYLKAQKPKSEPFVGIVHRLDRPVSGVLVLAKKKNALKILNEQFAQHRTRKKYYAIVEHRPEKDNAELRHFLYVNNKLKKAEIYDVSKKETHECRLKYRFVKKMSDGYLLDIELLTGKFNQIRAQLAHINCPIVGDEKYGAQSLFQRDAIALHAYQLTFFDTESGDKIISESSDFVSKNDN